VALALDRLGVPRYSGPASPTTISGRTCASISPRATSPPSSSVPTTRRRPRSRSSLHDASGERSFSFYRDRGADTRLEPGTVPDETLDAVSWVHTTGVTMSVEPSRAATTELQTRASGECVVSLDPNWRPGLWESRETYASVIRAALPAVDVLVASEGGPGRGRPHGCGSGRPRRRGRRRRARHRRDNARRRRRAVVRNGDEPGAGSRAPRGATRSTSSTRPARATPSSLG